MNLAQAKKLKAGDIVYHTSKRNADGTPMRARVTSIQTWITRPTEINVKVKHGLYDYATFFHGDIDLIEVSEAIARRRFFVRVSGQKAVVTEKKTGKTTRYQLSEFVYGQAMYNEDTDKYPNYVHKAVWAK